MKTRSASRFAPALRRTLGLVLALAMVASLGGCVGRAWQQALEEDTPSAYYRFMREHGDSEYADQAREHLDFHKLYREPTLTGYESFRRRYPNSDLLARLHPALEKPAFEAARAAGTARAYHDFVDRFPGGEFEARARGNAVFVESEGFGGDADRLASFAQAHPQSDFAAEAKRTVDAVAAKRAAGFDSIGLVLDVAADTPERKRVRTALIDRMAKLTERVGVKLMVAPDGVAPERLRNFPRARLEVRHTEAAVGREVEGGQLARPAMLGTTEVVLRAKAGEAPIATRRFELRVEDKSYVPGTSVLFGQTASKYWSEFFVPVASWRNDTTVRPPIALQRPVVDLDGFGDRTVVLYEDGDFELLGLADPTEPITLARYARGEDYKKWSGIRSMGGRIAIYGEEGLEFVRFTAKGPIAERTWNRGEIGRVLSIAPVGEQMVIASAKGLQVLDPATGEMRRVMRRIVKSVDALGETLVFVDGESVYLSTLALLAENRVIAQLKLGKTFGPNNVRVLDRAAVVTGPGGALVVDLANPKKPKAIAKLSSREVGEVVDASRVRGRTFLVGERGLQLLTRRLDRVEETIDVGARDRVSVMGRHLVASSAAGIQVVDSTPWANAPSPAAAR
ncbi:MAG: hypothetical protein NXI30_19035 [bacterium]|nr:hypothetical protein [bacterium]